MPEQGTKSVDTGRFALRSSARGVKITRPAGSVPSPGPTGRCPPPSIGGVSSLTSSHEALLAFARAVAVVGASSQHDRGVDLQPACDLRRRASSRQRTAAAQGTKLNDPTQVTPDIRHSPHRSRVVGVTGA